MRCCTRSALRRNAMTFPTVHAEHDRTAQQHSLPSRAGLCGRSVEATRSARSKGRRLGSGTRMNAGETADGRAFQLILRRRRSENERRNLESEPEPLRRAARSRSQRIHARPVYAMAVRDASRVWSSGPPNTGDAVEEEARRERAAGSNFIMLRPSRSWPVKETRLARRGGEGPSSRARRKDQIS
jgi:hypothetical protein